MRNLITIIFLIFFSFKNDTKKGHKQHTPEEFGAIGNGLHDDTMPLTRALNSGYNIYFNNNKRYKITSTININSVSNKIFDLQKAIIIRNPAKIGFSFSDCTNIIFRGGSIICSISPFQTTGSENCINFIQCKNITATRIHINGSNQMGIAFVCCIGVNASYNYVENCFRDGIHEIYCANVKIHNNKLNNIKDDALACHDYGTAAQKEFLVKNGYTQATNIEIYNNRITNSYQGISSIACKNITIKNNVISGTVCAAIAVFNTQAINVGGTAYVNGVKIQFNTINNSCNEQKIMGLSYKNNGQNSTGRAAIFVGTLAENSQLGGTKRLLNVSVTNNTVANAGVNGLWITSVDGINLSNNTFINCCIETSTFSGTVCVIYNTTAALISHNKTIDTRNTKKHNYGFDIQSVSGNVVDLVNTGSIYGNHIIASPNLTGLK